jgi:hypothetical protein
MSGPDTEQSKALAAAHEAGRRLGLATAALAVSIVSFLNLLGLEKSLLAVVLAALALGGSQATGTARKRSRIALVLGTVHIVTAIVVLLVFREELGELLNLLYELN